MFFLHGWPEISLAWRAQMEAFATAGWHCVAPDLRGFGGSSKPMAAEAYANEQVVADMAELHDHLGGRPAIWVGHDWGSCVVGALVAHEPGRSRGAVLVSVPYFADANTLPTLVPLVDRKIYPADQYPDGQWDYYRYYTTHFKQAVADLDADVPASLASIFQPGDAAAVGKPSPQALVTQKGGRFGAAHHAPPTQPDPGLWPPADFDVLVQAFRRHGFQSACSWYLNDDANLAYARMATNGGRLLQPVLFVNGEWDQINSISGNHMGDSMRATCPDLTVTARLLLRLNRPKEALPDLQAAEVAAPDEPTVQQLLARTYRVLGDRARADAANQRYLELNRAMHAASEHHAAAVVEANQ